MELDARQLLPPEPMERTLAALRTLPRGESLRLLLYREPFPLYAVLRREGFAWRCALEADGTYVITITAELP